MSAAARHAAAELCDLRKAAHRVFDRLWKKKLMSRNTAYRMLARAFGIGEDEAHFARFDAKQCRRAIELWKDADPTIPRQHRRGRLAPIQHRLRKARLRDQDASDHLGHRRHDREEEVAA